MTKPKSNSIIDGLPAQQRQQVEAWLFDENISYKDAASRLWNDFGVKVSEAALSNWYSGRAQERMLDRIAASQRLKNEVVQQFERNQADSYKALLNLVGQIAFEKAMTSGELDADTIFNFTKLVMDGQKQAMQAADLQLRRDRFEFDAAKAALACLPQLRKIAADTGASEQDKLQQARLALFGSAPQ